MLKTVPLSQVLGEKRYDFSQRGWRNLYSDGQSIYIVTSSQSGREYTNLIRKFEPELGQITLRQSFSSEKEISHGLISDQFLICGGRNMLYQISNESLELISTLTFHPFRGSGVAVTSLLVHQNQLFVALESERIEGEKITAFLAVATEDLRVISLSEPVSSEKAWDRTVNRPELHLIKDHLYLHLVENLYLFNDGKVIKKINLVPKERSLSYVQLYYGKILHFIRDYLKENDGPTLSPSFELLVSTSWDTFLHMNYEIKLETGPVREFRYKMPINFNLVEGDGLSFLSRGQSFRIYSGSELLYKLDKNYLNNKLLFYLPSNKLYLYRKSNFPGNSYESFEMDVSEITEKERVKTALRILRSRFEREEEVGKFDKINLDLYEKILSFL